MERTTISQELKSSRNEGTDLAGNDECNKVGESDNVSQGWEVWRRVREWPRSNNEEQGGHLL